MSATEARANASDELRHVLQDDEELLWRGTPNRRRLMVDALKVSPMVLVPLGMVGVFALWMVALSIEFSGGDPLSILPVFGGAAVLVVLLVLAGVFWYANRRYNHAEYAATDRRIVSFTGGFGRDSSSVDWGSVRDLEVSVGGIDGLFGTGTIYVATEGSGDITFRYLERPHELAAALDRVRSGDADRVELPDDSMSADTSTDTRSSASATASRAGVGTGGGGSATGTATG